MDWYSINSKINILLSVGDSVVVSVEVSIVWPWGQKKWNKWTK
jgi:hypothetical protein